MVRFMNSIEQGFELSKTSLLPIIITLLRLSLLLRATHSSTRRTRKDVITGIRIRNTLALVFMTSMRHVERIIALWRRAKSSGRYGGGLTDKRIRRGCVLVVGVGVPNDFFRGVCSCA